MFQTRQNGTGNSNAFGLIKPVGITIEPKLCKNVKKPSGSNKQNTFFQVDEVTGSCNTVLTADVSVATYPNPKSARSPNPVCDDSILLVQPTQANEAAKNTADYCPVCNRGFNGTNGHIDNFSSIEACSGHSATDLGDFWTADTQGETQ